MDFPARNASSSVGGGMPPAWLRRGVAHLADNAFQPSPLRRLAAAIVHHVDALCPDPGAPPSPPAGPPDASTP